MHVTTIKLVIIINIKEFENLSVEKRRFRLRWDSNPGLSIAGRVLRNFKLN